MIDDEYVRMAQIEDLHWWFFEKKYILNTFLRTLHSHSKILDIGAGTGGISTYLSRFGDVTRIESSTTAGCFLAKRSLPYIKADANTYQYGTNAYNVITCLDVLYHQNIDDSKLLHKLFRALKPGGHLIITDCALPWLITAHDRRNLARERYTLEKITSLVTANNFTVKKSSYTYFFVFPLFLMSRILERITGRSDVSLPPRYINTLLCYVSKMEVYLMRYISYPIGSSIVVVATKPA